MEWNLAIRLNIKLRMRKIMSKLKREPINDFTPGSITNRILVSGGKGEEGLTIT
jgi:hypothetical protein